MTFTPKKSQRELIPEGNHPAICYGVVDLGTQDTGFGPKRQMKIFWEFPKLRIDLERDGNTVNLPRVINKDYNPILHPKSNLAIHLTSWRGKSFSRDEMDSFDFFSLIGRACQLTIVHQESKLGMLYDKIISVVGPATVAEPENPPMKYAFEEHGKDIPDGVYGWLQDLIKESPEYKGESLPDEQHVPDDTSPMEPEQEIPF